MIYIESKRKLELKDKHGNQLTVYLRMFHEGDEDGIISCIRDEYGDTYFKRDFYSREYLKKEAEEGIITFLVAETEKDGIAGILILKQFYPEESMCEIASQIFRKKYRGFGLAMPFFEYGMEILLSRSYSAAFCLPVMFHDVTQRLLCRLGLRATGLILNVFDMNKITHSYYNGRNTKHSQGIQISAAGKRDAGKLYIPKEHQRFCRYIYEKLGVTYDIIKNNETNKQRNTMPEKSKIICRQDDVQSSLELRINCIGRDLKKCIEKLHKKYPFTETQTSNIFLNISDENAVWAYGILIKSGYFFTGLKPLCSKNEYMVLHNPGNVKMFFDDYKVSAEFKEILYYVSYTYENKKLIY